MSRTKPSGRGRHSFIQFYMSDWLAGTARMPRLARSVFFDVCCYNWDKMEPVPHAELMLMVSDLEGEQASFLVQNLIDTGKLIEDENGGVYCERAMAEAKRAYDAWEAKSRGGRKKPKDSGDTPPAIEEDSSDSAPKTAPAEPEPEPEPEPDEKGDSSTPSIDPAHVPLDEVKAVAEAWNAMAVKAGLSQIVKMTDTRKTKLRARIADHGLDTLLEAIETIHAEPFLMGRNDRGWKANIDWFGKPDACAKLIEGGYHNRGKGSGSGWTEE